MFHLSCSPRRAFILHRPHLSICALGVCLSLCGEQGQGILLTCDSDSTLNQGQRAGGKRKKGLHKFPSHLICDFERLRTGEQLIIHEEWILAPVDAFNVFVQVLRFKTTTLIHYRQNRAVKPEDQERNSNLISSGIFYRENATPSTPPSSRHIVISSEVKQICFKILPNIGLSGTVAMEATSISSSPPPCEQHISLWPPKPD